MNLGHDVRAVDHDRSALGRAQRDVQNGAMLGDIYVITAEHRVDSPAQIGFLRELDEPIESFSGDTILGVVEKDSGTLGYHLLAAFRVIGEKLPQMEVFDLWIMLFEGFPRPSLT
jgi:hypothetical protein